MTQTQNITQTLATSLVQKDFSTGSKGFHGQGKVVAQGKRYQAQTTLVLIGSKTDASLRVKASVAEAQQAVEELTALLAPKTFSSGKQGFYVQSKVTLAGQRFQASAQAVQIS